MDLYVHSPSTLKKKVHRAIEKEIHKEKVKVEVKTAEEMWALRFVLIVHQCRCLQDAVVEK